MDMYLDKLRIEEMYKRLMDRLDRMEEKLMIKDMKIKLFDGEPVIDNQEMCLMLGVSKRTLARYRQKGLVKYYTMDGRKMYYKLSEVHAFLRKNEEAVSDNPDCVNEEPEK